MKTTATSPGKIGRTKPVLSTAALLMLLHGCGSSADGTGHDPAARGSVENTGAAESAVVTGATNVSDGIVPGSSRVQGETAAAGNGPYQMVAYNADDGQHESGADYCLNYSEIGISYNSNNTWRGLRFPTPSGIAMLRGDPAVSVIDAGPSFSFFVVSSMAVTTATWNSVKQPDQCPGGSGIGYDQYVNDKNATNVCYTLVVVPKDQSAAYFYGATCVHPSSATDYVDGTTVYADVQNGQGNVYVAYANKTHWTDATPSGTIEAFKNGAALPNPFPNKKMIGHPEFIQDAGNIPTLVAPDSSGYFWVARWNESSSNPGWSVFALTGSGTSHPYKRDQLATLGDGKTKIVSGQFSGDMYSASPYDNLVFFYTAPVGTKMAIEGASCRFQGASVGSCSRQTAWNVPTTANAIFPAVAVANVNGTTNYPAVTYWTDSTGSANLTLMLGTVTLSTNAMSITSTGISQVPCPYSDGYWGDYDGMAVWGNGGSVPLLLRYFSDSTPAGSCNGGVPQHVSAYSSLP